LNIDEYRQGYEDGVEASKTPGRDIADSIFALTDNPSYRKGYKDGFNDRPFNPGELGLFDTDDDDESDDEIEEESGGGRPTSDHGYLSSGGGDSEPAPAASIPLTASEKRKIFIGRLVVVSTFCVSTAFDLTTGKPLTLGVLGYAVFVAAMCYVAYRVAYRAKLWLIPLLIWNVFVFLFYEKTTNFPFLEVCHRIVIGNLDLLVGVALIYGIYKFLTA
jgi:hypothetical protein